MTDLLEKIKVEDQDREIQRNSDREAARRHSQRNSDRHAVGVSNVAPVEDPAELAMLEEAMRLSLQDMQGISIAGAAAPSGPSASPPPLEATSPLVGNSISISDPFGSSWQADEDEEALLEALRLSRELASATSS